MFSQPISSPLIRDLIWYFFFRRFFILLVFSSLFFFLLPRGRGKTERKMNLFTFEYLGVTLTTFEASRETVFAITAPHPSRKARRITARLVPGGPLILFVKFG